MTSSQLPLSQFSGILQPIQGITFYQISPVTHLPPTLPGIRSLQIDENEAANSLLQLSQSNTKAEKEKVNMVSEVITNIIEAVEKDAKSIQGANRILRKRKRIKRSPEEKLKRKRERNKVLAKQSRERKKKRFEELIRSNRAKEREVLYWKSKYLDLLSTVSGEIGEQEHKYIANPTGSDTSISSDESESQ